MPIETEYRGVDGYIYLTACKYYRAAGYIPSEDRGAPYYVNLAFAIELFIKCLDVTTKTVYESEAPFHTIYHKQKIHTRVRGHSLKNMFESLPEETRNSIAQAYEITKGNNILDDLEQIKDVFVDWRYHFEKDKLSIPIDVIEKISGFFKDYIDHELRNKQV